MCWRASRIRPPARWSWISTGDVGPGGPRPAPPGIPGPAGAAPIPVPEGRADQLGPAGGPRGADRDRLRGRAPACRGTGSRAYSPGRCGLGTPARRDRPTGGGRSAR
ncbi:hypothetical protein GCM10023329_19500 [Streptomyces sanyensis]|uniref:Uncharacterized protein n=1 Tax=Streptomyces sanyensis TaxID=568869 RepID=A0ABP9A277_9ACTN